MPSVFAVSVRIVVVYRLPDCDQWKDLSVVQASREGSRQQLAGFNVHQAKARIPRRHQHVPEKPSVPAHNVIWEQEHGCTQVLPYGK